LVAESGHARLVEHCPDVCAQAVQVRGSSTPCGTEPLGRLEMSLDIAG